MQMLTRLVDIYRRNGFEIVTGVTARQSNNWSSELTFLLKDTTLCTNHLGIAPQELRFMESVLQAVEAKNILVIGNSFGWSTLGLALASPASKIVAMDIADEAFTEEWIGRTNDIAQAEGLNVKAVVAASPDGVEEVVTNEFDGGVDFAFIDANHTNEAVFDDFTAARAQAAPGCVYAFHDVLGFGLYEGCVRAKESAGLEGRVIFSTPTGMMLLYEKSVEERLDLTFATYGATVLAEGVLNMLRQREAGRIVK